MSKKLNELYALNIFKQGLNEQFISTVFAAQPKNFSDAVNIAMEVEGQVQSQIMFFRNNGDNRKNSENRNNRNNNNYYNNNNSGRYNNNNSGKSNNLGFEPQCGGRLSSLTC